MLHALLHHKLDPLRPEVHRLEDALTSVVFTTLLHAQAGEEMARWLAKGAIIRGDPPPLQPTIEDVWFWPRLSFAEPDVVIRLGSTLVIVEAKLRSNRHDRSIAAEDDGHFESDQIRRQWKSLTDPHATGIPALQRAIADCPPLLVYIVDGRRLGRARRELSDSVEALPANAAVRLLTWQSLYCLLVSDAARPAWKRDLIDALELFGVGGFAGFGSIELPTHTHESLRWLTLARPRPPRWASATLDERHVPAVKQWAWAPRPKAKWTWNAPALTDVRRQLVVLAPFLLNWMKVARTINGDPI